MTINLNETDDVNVSMNEDDDVDAMDMNMDIPDDGDNDSPGLDIDSYDFAKEQKYKKIGLAAIIGTIVLVFAALFLAVFALTSQKSNNREIKEWVAQYLTEKLEAAGLSTEGIENITDDLNTLLADSLGTEDLNFDDLTEDQVKDLISKISGTLDSVPADEAERIANGLVSGYVSKATGSDIQTEDYQTLVSRLNDLEYNDKQLSNAITTVSETKGSTGATGAQGAQGVQGPQGIQGVKGDKGDKGDQGLKGDTGAAGKNGKDGIDGKDGATGKSAYELYVETEKAAGRTPASQTEWQENLKGDSAHTIYKVEKPDGTIYFTDDVTNLPEGDKVTGSTVVTCSDKEWANISAGLGEGKTSGADESAALGKLETVLGNNNVPPTVVNQIVNNTYTVGPKLGYSVADDGTTPVVTITQ